MRDPDFTLSAGPAMASPRVLAALGSPITYHHDPAFLEAFRATEDKVAELFLTECDVLLLPGEAVLGLEAAARALVKPGAQVLNLVSGIFGKGMSYWLRTFGAELHELEVSYDDSVDPADVQHYLAQHPQIELVTVVHVETPSGTLNDISAIGPIAHANGALTLVDCVASLGGISYRTDEWQVDVSVAGPHKCLGGPSGISLMTVSEAAWARMRGNPAAPRASALSMLDWKEKWLEGGTFASEPSVSDIHGLEAACDELFEEGLEASIARHERAAAATRAAAKAMGLDLWPRGDEVAAASVTAIRVPEPLTDVQVVQHCRERYGVMISGGDGVGNLVRIGHMGPTARSLYPIVGLTALASTLHDLGASADLGAGVEAAMEILSDTDHRAAPPKSHVAGPGA